MTDYLDRSADYQQQDASIFDEMAYWASKFAALIFDNLELRPNQNILDLGCGTGCPLFELAHMHGPSCQFTGADLWTSGLERAKTKLAIYGLPNVKLVQLEGNTLPFPDAEFDLIVSNLTLNNFEDAAATLKECARVTKPDGRIAMTTNLKGHMIEFYAVYGGVLSDFGNPDYLIRMAANEAHRGTRESHIETVTNAGFHITKIIEDQFTLRFLDGSALLRHSLIRFGFLEGWRRVLDPADERTIFSTLEARLNALAQQEGDLRMTIPMLYLEAVKG